MFVLIPMFSCFISAAEALDQDINKRDVPTRRMIKKTEKARNPPPAKVPNFLMHFSKSGKIVKSSDGCSKTPFIPDWSDAITLYGLVHLLWLLSLFC